MELFGFKLIRQKEYEKMEDNFRKANKQITRLNDTISLKREENIKLAQEIQRLGELISANNENCAVGVWCKDCDHVGTDCTEITTDLYDSVNKRFITVNSGVVIYCKKHLHNLCPEHSKNIREE